MSILSIGLAAGVFSLLLLTLLARHDPKHLRAQRSHRRPYRRATRRLLALCSLLPGLLLIGAGWWSALLVWAGATLTVGWLVVLALSPPEPSPEVR